jgi:hypothetical protein
VDWIYLAQDRDHWGRGESCEHGIESSGSIKDEEFLD